MSGLGGPAGPWALDWQMRVPRAGASLEARPGLSQVEKVVRHPGREEPGRGDGLF